MLKHSINIVFIASNPIIRTGLEMWLKTQENIYIMAVFENVEALENRLFKGLDLILFDSINQDGFQKLKQLKNISPLLKTLCLSSSDELFNNYFFSTMETDLIHAILPNDVTPNLLLETIYDVFSSESKETLISSNVKERLFGDLYSEKALFTEKELDLLGILGHGKTTKEAAKILNLSSRTIDCHRRRIITKLGCQNIIPAILYAIQYKYIDIKLEDCYLQK